MQSMDVRPLRCDAKFVTWGLFSNELDTGQAHYKASIIYYNMFYSFFISSLPESAAIDSALIIHGSMFVGVGLQQRARSKEWELC